MDSGSDAIGGLAALSFLGVYSAFSILYMCFYLIMCLVGVAGLVLWIMMIVDVAQREDKDFPGESKDQKTMWVLIIVLGGMIGAFIYYLLVYQKAKQLNSAKK
jgi:prolipoprotein diacylglyceryltransferase